MDYNILIGGAAGQGMDTVASMLTKVLQKSGYYTFQTENYRSRVRGGHNFYQIRFSDRPVEAASRDIDLIFALNEETLDRHLDRLKDSGVAIADDGIEASDRVRSYDFNDKAKEIGNEIVLTTIGLGIIMGHFGLNLQVGQDIIHSIFADKSEKVQEMNIEALKYGYELNTADAQDLEERETILLDGNSAVGMGAVAAGVKFYCGYPMTPSSGVLGYIADVAEEMNIVVDQVEDEVAALNMALGASYAGVRAMTGSSGGGLALMQEALSLAGILEQPIVIVNVQRPGPATGLPTDTEQADLRFMVHGGHGEFPRKIIALRNAKDAFYQTVRAFNIAEKYQIPVILLSDQYIADTMVNIEPFDLSKVEIDRHLANPEDFPTGEYQRYAFTETNISPRLIPGCANGNVVRVDSDEHNEAGLIDESADNRKKMVEKRLNKIAPMWEEDMEEPWEIGVDDFTTLIVSWGSTYGVVKEAVETLNQEDYKIKALSYADVFPLKTDKFLEYYEQADKYLTIENNATGQFESLLRQEALVKADHQILKYDGRPFFVEDLVEEIKELI